MKFLVFNLLLFISSNLFANTYYLSSTSGDDSRSVAQAQNSSTPWKTLDKLNAVFSILNPGDSVLFKSGDVFDGAISVTKSGTANNPITFAAYGIGKKPVINGFITLSDWSSAGNGVFEVTNPSFNTSVSTLLINGMPRQIGRYPNSNAPNKGYLTITNTNGSNNISDPSLSSVNWTGGDVVVRKNRWVLDRNPITNQSGSTISYQSESANGTSAGFGYFIINHPKTLDEQGEWCYNRSAKKLSVYLGKANADAYDIKASCVNTLVSINNQSNVIFDNISFEGANNNAFDISSSNHIEITNCDILYTGNTAINSSVADYLTISNTSVYYTNNIAFNLTNCSNATVSNNKIKCTGIFAGMGKGDSGSYEAILMNGNNHTVTTNTIDSTGYIAITFRGSGNIIKNNYITNFTMVKDDGSGIYSWNNFPNPAPYTGTKITGNIILNGLGAGAGTPDTAYSASSGIYMDDNTSGAEISDNTVASCGLYGIYLHNAHELTLKNNTLFDNGKSQIGIAEDNYAPSPVRNIDMRNNIFFSKEEQQPVAEFTTINNDIANFGTFNNNNYSRPVFDYFVINTSHSFKPNVGYTSNSLDLEDWKTNYNKDAASTRSPIRVFSTNNIKFLFNPSTSAKTYSLNSNFIDVYNKTYSASITLKPFTSIILIKKDADVPSASLCTGTGSIVLERWENVNGVSVSDIPVSKRAEKTIRISKLEISNIGGNYGSRIRGYVCPPQSGNYTFLLASDDASALFLSTDNNPANKRKIAEVTEWTYFREWDKYPSQKSIKLNLQAGQKYYIEVLHKEGAGDDHVSVAWQLPNGKLEVPIAETRILPFGDNSDTKFDQDINFDALPKKKVDDKPFEVSAIASSGLPVSFRIVSGPATISDNIITVTGIGTVVVEAYQPGNTVYNAASVNQSFKVLGVSSTPACSATGTILRETWNGEDGNDISDVPLNTVPDISGQISAFEGPVNASDLYASRIRGYICPPQTGNYTFWIAGDDATELWLSTDSDPANKAKIAYNLAYTESREWDKYPTQRSVEIYLQAGKKYYVEALHKEGAGGDNIAVAWQLPDGAKEAPIPGSRLSPYQTSTTAKDDQTITFPSLSSVIYGVAPFALSATASSGLPVSFRIASGPATLSENIITITGSGTVVIEASQRGNAAYNAAPAITRQLIVLPAAATACSATGTILREVWNDEDGNNISDIPLSVTPDINGLLSAFEGPVNSADLYATRIRGYICPPQTGYYTFWIAGDDATELYLSSDSDPANKTKIAYNLSYTDSREWDKYPTQKSVQIYLQAGKKYYIESLHKEGAGGDNIAVAWQLPDGAMEAPIPGSRLSPYQAPTTVKADQTITFPSLSSVAYGVAPFKLNAAASSDLPVKFKIVSGPATISGNTITITDEGTVVVEASQAGNAAYNAAPVVTRRLIVLPSVSTGCSNTGTITRDLWFNVNGIDITDIPLTTAPARTDKISAFEGSQNFYDRYATRIRGYICPPQTGNYTFWIAGDDATELWLSTDNNPSAKTKIAYNLSYTTSRHWNKYPTQKSMQVFLQAGQNYYIEALHKEQYGQDNIAVAWQLPDGTMEAPIPGKRLMPYNATPAFRNANSAGNKNINTNDNVYKTELTCSPNPFYETAVVKLVTAESGKISLKVFDLQGRTVQHIFEGLSDAGVTKKFVLNRKELSSGIYIIRLYTNTKVISRKIVLAGKQ